MKAVIYARYSCDNQREESIEGQLRECKMVLTFNFREGTETITFADLQAALQRDEKSSNMNSVGVP